jgi:hypothetical protein
MLAVSFFLFTFALNKENHITFIILLKTNNTYERLTDVH